MEGMSVTFKQKIKRVRKKGKCQRKRHENEGLLVVFRSSNIACISAISTGDIKILKIRLPHVDDMPTTLQAPGNDYSKHYIMTGKALQVGRWKE